MVDKPSPEEERDESADKAPALSQDFYKALLDLPSCMVSGFCDNCGRCEH